MSKSTNLPAKRRLSFSSAITSWFSRPAQRRADLWEKSEMGIWAETLNPLRGLTAQRAADIFDRARRGVYAELAWLYQEIEAADPTLFVCTERREAAAGACDWRISLGNPDRTPGFEENLANEQKDFLSQAFGRAGDEIGALAEHLGRGFFRGFAHARPVISEQGVDGFEFYDQWNFCRDPATGAWWWNPDAAFSANDAFQLIPAGELITLERSRHIDYPALSIYIRAALGEKKWGIFLERYGIPPVTIIMPEFADKTEEAAYMAAAEKLARAGSGALPYGSTVSYATDARGVNPFMDFLRHQQELTVLLATGGLLTTLTAPGSGTLAGEAHLDTWAEVVSRDIRAVSRAVNRSATHRLLDARFPGRPRLAFFEFDPEATPTAGEVFADAGKAKAAGYLIDQADLEERTGYKLVPDPQNNPVPPPFNPYGVANKAPTTPDHLAKRRTSLAKLTTPPTPHNDPPKVKTPQKAVSVPPVPSRPDPVAAALDALEGGATPDEAMDAYDAAAKAALAPDVIAARAEFVAVELDAAAAEGAGAVANTNPNREATGVFAAEGAGDMTAGGETADGANPDSSAAQAAEIGKGKKAAARSLADKTDVYDAVHRGDIGGITYTYGEPGDPAKGYKGGHGLSHIVAKHGQETVDKLHKTLVGGKLGPVYEQGRKRNVTLGGSTAALRLDRDGKRETWVVTSFDTNK